LNQTSQPEPTGFGRRKIYIKKREYVGVKKHNQKIY